MWPLLWTACMCLPRFLCWSPNSSVMVLGGRGAGQWLGYEGGLMNEIWVLITDTREAVSASPPSESTTRGQPASANQQVSRHQTPDLLDFQLQTSEESLSAVSATLSVVICYRSQTDRDSGLVGAPPTSASKGQGLKLSQRPELRSGHARKEGWNKDSPVTHNTALLSVPPTPVKGWTTEKATHQQKNSS